MGVFAPEDALARLREGNRRFAAEACRLSELVDPAERGRLVAGQQPFAVVLGCSDSRVPVEIVFDQGPGALFVSRGAGHVVAPSQVASVEFAVERFGTRLVVVLGHTRCGAVQAALDELLTPRPPDASSLGSITSRIRPALAGLLATDLARDRDHLLRAAVRSNVRASVEALRRGSPVLERLTAEARLRVGGAEYALETGRVEFLEEVGDR